MVDEGEWARAGAPNSPDSDMQRLIGTKRVVVAGHLTPWQAAMPLFIMHQSLNTQPTSHITVRACVKCMFVCASGNMKSTVYAACA